jgi:hypothetical protein
VSADPAPLVTVPFLAAAIVLAGAGAAKLARPTDTAKALRDAGMPLGRRAVRVGAAGEIAVAVATLLWSSPIGAALVALSYTSFAVWVVTALRRGWALSSCGCFGKPDTPPTRAHAALDAAAALCALVWAVESPGSLRSVVASTAWHGAAIVVVSVVVAGLAYLLWTKPMGRMIAA